MSVVPFVTGRTCVDGGMERPRRGVRLAELLREPGIGGRRRGAGEDMVEGREVERLELLLDARMEGFWGGKLVVLLVGHGFREASVEVMTVRRAGCWLEARCDETENRR
jgi:hypothetical protein